MFKIANEQEVNDQLLKAIDNRMDDIIDFISAEAKDNLDRHGTTHTGQLRKSISPNKKFLVKELAVTAPYADVIEFGRLPGTTPPVKPIQEWARLKLGLSRKEAERAGWAISKSIEQHGTRPQPYLRPSLQAARRRFK